MSVLRAIVPATCANVGPGFDSLALAVDLVNVVEVDRNAPAGVEVRGEGAGELPEDASNLVFRAMAFLAREAGGALPEFRLRCTNAIPLQRGLGSSAAAVVAGLVVADSLLGTALDGDRLLELAADVEGHPDNAAACLRGGVAVAYLSRRGWRAEALRADPALRPVLLIPLHERLPTQDARRVLPPAVSRADAVFNLSRAALLPLALGGRHDLLAEALEDRVHQPARLPLVPAARALFEDLREAGVPVCVSGAGPTLLAFETEAARVPALGPGWRVERTTVRSAGATVEES